MSQTQAGLRSVEPTSIMGQHAVPANLMVRVCRILCGSVLVSVLAQGALDLGDRPIPRPDRNFVPAAVAANLVQDRAELRRVDLHSGSFFPVGSVEANWVRLRTDLADRHKVRALAGFAAPPTEAELMALDQAGIRIGRALSGGVRFALVDPGIEAQTLRSKGLVWVGGFYPEDKVPPRMLRSGFGDWAVRQDGLVTLRLRYFPEVAEAELRQALVGVGARVEWVRPELEAAEILMEPLALHALLALDAVRWVEEAPPKPVEFNDSALAQVGVDELWVAPYGLSGAGVMVGLCDSGQVDALHQDFQGRIELLELGSVSEHATHVAGTLGGTGVMSTSRGGGSLQWRGVASGVRIGSFDFVDPIPTHQVLVDRGGIISQNSWGLSLDPTSGSCGLYGTYGSLAPDYDRLVLGLYGHPLSVVFAVGNMRAGDAANACAVGPYGTVGPPGTAKNALSVGAVDSITDAMTAFSGWGPLKDGRLKPELVAPGAQASGDGGVTSTIPANRYGVKQGTSMAAPVVSGGMALLAEEYRALFAGTDPLPATLRALLIHTCKDLDDQTPYFNPGPDYASGYGRLQLREAVDLLRSGGFLVSHVSHLGTHELRLEVAPGNPEVRFTLVWDDPPGLENAAVALVNDLDLVVVDPLGQRHYPWTLDPLNPAAPATRTGPDRRNVIEQVYVEGPVPAGTWLVQVVGTAVVEGDRQTFALAMSPALPMIPPVVSLEAVRMSEDPNGGSNQNGSFDPGEEVQIETVLRNEYVPSIESVTARLESDSPGVTILQGEAEFPMLLAGGAVTNLSPFRVRLSRDLPCGSVLQLRQIASADGFVFENPMELVVGNYVVTNAGTNVFLSADVPKAIPDGGGDLAPAKSTLTLEGTGQVGNLAVWVRINHTWAGDLNAELVHPDGTRVRLWHVTGIEGRDYGAGACGDNTGWTMLRDGAELHLTNSAAPFVGVYRPAEPLAALAEKPIAGTWTLRVADGWLGDHGDLLCWGLDLGFQQAGYVCDAFNRPPAALQQSLEVFYGQPTVIQLAGTDPDEDSLSFALLTQPAHGEVVEFDSGTGMVLYQPSQGYIGPDGFSFTVSDGLAESVPADINLTVMDAAADVALAWAPGTVVAGLDRIAVSELVVTNRGPNAIHDLVVAMQLPPVLALDLASPGFGTVIPTPEGLRWEVDGLAAGESVALRLSVRVGEAGLHGIAGSAAFAEIELEPADNTALWLIDARPISDLAIDLSGPGEPILLGQSGSVDLTVLNHGPATAHGVLVEAQLPPGWDWLGSEISRGEWIAEGLSAQWLIGELQAGESLLWRWNLIAHEVGEGIAAATATALEVDEIDLNNSAAVQLTVVPASDLAVGVDGPAQSFLGQIELLTVAVTNLGPNAAVTVVVRGEWDATLTEVQPIPDQTDWRLDADQWEWTVGLLPAGSEAVLQLQVKSQATGRAFHSVEVDSALADPRPANNRTEFGYDIVPAADLQVTVAPLTLLVLDSASAVGFQLANAGPSDAGAVVMEVAVAPGLHAEPVEGDSGNWTQTATGVWVWQVGDLPAGELRTASLAFLGETIGVWTNNVAAHAQQADPDPDSSSVTFRVEVRADADLQLSGWTGHETMLQGQWSTQRVEVVNAGPNLATAIEVQSTLSTGWRVIAAEVSEGSTDVNLGGLIWAIDSLESGGNAWMQLVLEAEVHGILTNRLLVIGNEVDLVPDNNLLELATTVMPAADLRLSVVHPQKVLLQGVHDQEWILFNAGPGPVSELTATSLLPEGLALVEAEPEEGTVVVNAGQVSWNVGALAAGEEVRLRLTLRGESLGDWVQQVLASGLETDPTPEDNLVELTTAVRVDVDLRLTKAVTGSPVPLGQSLEYILVLENLGPHPAHHVLMEDPLPAGLVFQNAALSLGSYVETNGVLYWSIGQLLQGDQAVLSLSALAVDTGTWTNVAWVQADEVDVHPANNTASVVALVVPTSDLAVELVAPPTWFSGYPGEWRVTVANFGPSDAEGVVVNGVLDVPVESESAEPSTGEWTLLEDGRWTWNLGRLAAGTQAALRLRLWSANLGPVSHQVEVVGSSLDLEPANNQAAAGLDLVPAADFQLQGQGDTRIRFELEQASQSWAVTNAGPSDATGVVVYGQLESGLVIAQHAVSSGSWTLQGGDWSWDLGALAAGEGAILTLTMDGIEPGAWAHTVRVLADQADPTPEDSHVTWVTGVRIDTDLGVTKTAVSSFALLGSPCVYQIGLTNLGPNPAGAVRVSDVLPVGLSFVGGLADLGEVTHASGRVEWVVPALEVGAQATLWLTNRAETLGWITNQVEVQADEFDLIPHNDLAQASIKVLPAADLILQVQAPDLLIPGSEFNALVLLSNDGPSTATTVVVAGSGAEGITITEGRSETGTWTNDGHGNWLWTVGELPVGEQATLELTGLGWVDGSWTHHLVAVAQEDDPRPADNEAEMVVWVRADADLLLTANATNWQVLRGEPFMPEIRVSNAGPNHASEVTVLQFWNDERLASPEPVVSDGVWRLEEGVLVWVLPHLAAGAEAWIRLPTVALVEGMLNRTVSVQATQPDLDPQNNLLVWSVESLPAADLAVELSGAAVHLPGAPLTLDVIVHNAGPGDASQLVVRGGAADDWNGATADPEVGTWTLLAEGGWAWELQALPAGGSALLRLVLESRDLGDWLYQVFVSGAEADPILENNESIWIARVRLDADLGVAASVIPGSVLQGTEFVLGLTVTNLGANSAHSVLVQGNLPTDTEVLSVAGDGGTWTEAAWGFTWELEVLEAGLAANLELKLRTSAIGGTTNQVTVIAEEFDADPENNLAVWGIEVQPVAQLGRIPPQSQSRLLAQEWTEVFWVTNSGPAAATLVLASGQLPEGLTLLAWATDDGTFAVEDEGSWTWDIGTIGVDEAVALELAFQASLPGLWTNRVELAAAEQDYAPDSRVIEWTVEVLPAADLSVLGGTDVLLPLQGSSVHEIIVTNRGPSDATGVLLQGIIPEGLRLMGHTLTAGRWEEIQNLWRWEVGDLPVGSQASLSLETGAAVMGDWTNRVEVLSSLADPNLNDNGVSWITKVRPSSDLGVSASVAMDLVVVGRPVTLDLALTNAGPDTATAILVTHEFSGGQLADVVEAGSGLITHKLGQVIWHLDELAAGTEAHVMITLMPTFATGLTNRIEVAAEVVDPVTENNEITFTLEAQPLADLRLVQSASAQRVLAGDAFRYRLVLSNFAPYDVPSVIIRNQLADGVELISAVSSVGTVIANGQVVSVNIGQLPMGGVATVDLAVRAYQVGMITNLAQVETWAADLDDPDLRTFTQVEVVRDPPMEVSLDGDKLELSWPTLSEAYELHYTDSLTEPIQWQIHPQPPAVSDGRLRVTVKTVPQGRYYRLFKP